MAEAWVPLFLFSVLFGLSMDYHALLLSRIREHYDVTQDNAVSVALGLRTTSGAPASDQSSGCLNSPKTPRGVSQISPSVA